MTNEERAREFYESLPANSTAEAFVAALAAEFAAVRRDGKRAGILLAAHQVYLRALDMDPEGEVARLLRDLSDEVRALAADREPGPPGGAEGA
jgi:hypothetical protein